MNETRSVRLIDSAITKGTSRNMFKDSSKSRAFLLDRDAMVEMLVSQVLDGTVNDGGSEKIEFVIRNVNHTASNVRRKLYQIISVTPPGS